MAWLLKLWHPDTGEIEHPAVYDSVSGRIRLPLHLDPFGSVFVLFRQPAPPERFVRIMNATLPILNAGTEPAAPSTVDPAGAPLVANLRADGTLDVMVRQAGTYRAETNTGKAVSFAVKEISHPVKLETWDLTFPSDSGVRSPLHLEHLSPWNQNNDPHIKYFSGTAIYRSTFQLPATAISPDQAVVLDLGDVQVIASVKVNGQDLGTQWKPPYRVRLDKVVRPGANTVEVAVTNVWHNRLLGQIKEPQSFAGAGLFQPFDLSPTNIKRNSPLFPSGMIGPAKVELIPHLILTAKAAPLPPKT